MKARDRNGDLESESENKTIIVCFSGSDIWMDGGWTEQSMKGWMTRWMDGGREGGSVEKH
jgi:hypothetical protein